MLGRFGVVWQGVSPDPVHSPWMRPWSVYLYRTSPCRTSGSMPDVVRDTGSRWEMGEVEARQAGKARAYRSCCITQCLPLPLTLPYLVATAIAGTGDSGQNIERVSGRCAAADLRTPVVLHAASVLGCRTKSRGDRWECGDAPVGARPDQTRSWRPWISLNLIFALTPSTIHDGGPDKPNWGKVIGGASDTPHHSLSTAGKVNRHVPVVRSNGSLLMWFSDDQVLLAVDTFTVISTRHKC